MVGLAASLVASLAHADVILSIDLDLSTNGVQNTITATNGGNFQAGIVLEVNGGSTVSGYIFALGFDNPELSIANFTPNLPGGFFSVNTAVTTNSSPEGTVTPIEGLTLGAPLSNFTQQIATFTIQPQNLANDGTDIIAKFISGQGQGISNAANNPIPLGVTAGDGGVFFNGGTINISAVPEPSICCSVPFSLGSAFIACAGNELLS